MLSDQRVDKIATFFDDALIEMFTDRGHQIRCSAFTEETTGNLWVSSGGVPETPHAYIDANSDELKLAIVLRVPWAVLTLTHSALNTSNAIEPEDCVDWLGEIANQIIGRLKQKLLRHGCPVQIGLPKTTSDASFEYPLSPLALKIPRAFELEDERIECLLAVEILSEALVLAPEREQEGNSSSGDQYDEGELELF